MIQQWCMPLHGFLLLRMKLLFCADINVQDSAGIFKCLKLHHIHIYSAAKWGPEPSSLASQLYRFKVCLPVGPEWDCMGSFPSTILIQNRQWRILLRVKLACQARIMARMMCIIYSLCWNEIMIISCTFFRPPTRPHTFKIPKKIQWKGFH